MKSKSPVPARFDIAVPRDVRDFFVDIEVTGHGGFQSLCRSLQARLRQSSMLHLDATEFSRIARYSAVYGDGGFQSRLRKIVASWVHQNLHRLAA